MIFRSSFLVGALALLALTRAEIIERFRAAPVTQVEGLVQVWADCPSEMRREFQLPVAGFVGGVCRTLYASEAQTPKRFAEPGIVVYVGDVTTNQTNIVVRTFLRNKTVPFMRIYIPAPGFADRDALRTATARGYYLAVHGERIDDAEARTRLRRADPNLRVQDEIALIRDWQNGMSMDDEGALALMRRVMTPGEARPHDVQIFASRLFLYPPQYDVLFAGRYRDCTFAEAIGLSVEDPCVRLCAFQKMTELVIFGGGRGPRMNRAVEGYVDFLRALYEGKPAVELRALLDLADDRLKGVLD